MEREQLLVGYVFWHVSLFRLVRGRNTLLIIEESGRITDIVPTSSSAAASTGSRLLAAVAFGALREVVIATRATNPVAVSFLPICTAPAPTSVVIIRLMDISVAAASDSFSTAAIIATT